MEGPNDEEAEESSSDESADLSKQLLRASKDGDLTEVKRLVEVEHVDPNILCVDDEIEGARATPLHLASGYGHLDIVRYFVEERNCCVECRDEEENTPLHYAAEGGRFVIVQYLIREGCDPMCKDTYSRTPLYDACREGNLDVVKYLIEDANAECSCIDVVHATPLHIAALNGKLSVVKLLVEDYLCDPEVKDRNGHTPADKAKSKGHTHVTSYLSSIENIVSSECQDEVYYYCVTVFLPLQLICVEH